MKTLLMSMSSETYHIIFLAKFVDFLILLDFFCFFDFLVFLFAFLAAFLFLIGPTADGTDLGLVLVVASMISVICR